MPLFRVTIPQKSPPQIPIDISDEDSIFPKINLPWLPASLDVYATQNSRIPIRKVANKTLLLAAPLPSSPSSSLFIRLLWPGSKKDAGWVSKETPSGQCQLVELTEYDDGLDIQADDAMCVPCSDDDNEVGGINSNSNPNPPPKLSVSCRICRDGLHDVEDVGVVREREDSVSDLATTTTAAPATPTTVAEMVTADLGPTATPTKSPSGSITHPYHSNPLLSPCECTGSMAFVHLFCIEVWRTRSRHPQANNGANCETCCSPYFLPPPAARPVSENNDPDNLMGMPPHVIAALRNPPWLWSVLQFLLQTKFVRQLTPLLLSPLLSLYCRSRRCLKKRGVSRRRWACR